MTQFGRDKTTPGFKSRHLTSSPLGLLSMASIALALVTGSAQADEGHGTAEDGHGMPHFAFGQPGQLADVDRTIEIEAGDIYFAPAGITVEAGETIRFLITNTGAVVHDFTLGSPAMQESHRAEMMNMMAAGAFDALYMHQAVAHQDWNAIMLNPDERRVMIWTFDEAGTLEYGCNVPGHYENGMRGEIDVVD